MLLIMAAREWITADQSVCQPLFVPLILIEDRQTLCIIPRWASQTRFAGKETTADCQHSSSANYSDGLIIKADSLKWDQSQGVCDLEAYANFW